MKENENGKTNEQLASSGEAREMRLESRYLQVNTYTTPFKDPSWLGEASRFRWAKVPIRNGLSKEPSQLYP